MGNRAATLTHAEKTPENNAEIAIEEAGTQLERAPLAQRVIVFLAVVLPFIAFIAAIFLTWGQGGLHWTQLSVFAAMYVITGLGITIGYHRLFTHRAFEAVKPVKWFFAIAGSMAVEGPVLKWVATHRRHHQHSDEEHDPHSPHGWGAGLKGVISGFWHAHVGWLFAADPPELDSYVKDLREDTGIRIISKLFPLWVALGLAIPAILGGIMTQSWWGALIGFIWGGLVRVFMVHHTTWSINSVCHLWGSKTYKSRDESRNNLIFGVLGFGEGWHNNHHAFPTSARHGLAWWQLDISYIVILMMKATGLAWNLRLPSATALAAKRTRQPKQSSESAPNIVDAGIAAVTRTSGGT